MLSSKDKIDNVVEPHHTKEGKMAELFNYSTFRTSLDSKTRSLTISFNADKTLSLEKLFELESIFSWLTNKVEISSVIICCEDDEFLGDWSQNQAAFNDQYIKKVVQKVRKLNQAMMHLPQTFIVDFGSKAQGIAVELAIGADLRLARNGAQITFNHLKQGFMPAAGTLSQLNQFISPAIVKNWVLSGRVIPQQQLTSTGFIYQTYDETQRRELVDGLLDSIHSQSQIQRIQSKMGLNEPVRFNNEMYSDFENSIFNASLVSEDWKINQSKDNSSMPSKHFAEVVKLSRPNQTTIEMKDNSNEKMGEVKFFRRPEQVDN